MRIVVVVLLAIAVSGCEAARMRRLTRHSVVVAEALTSPTLTEQIRLAPRMFTPVQLNDACRNAMPVEKLVAVPLEVDLLPGATLSLTSFSVVALNRAGVVIRDQPIAIEIQDAAPPTLHVRSDDPGLQEGRLRAIGTGRFTLRFRTICGTPYREIEIDGEVADG